MNDAIKLTIPHERSYYGVARLVVGGLAARLDFSYESLEDLQVALESVLDGAYASGDDVTVEVTVAPGAVEMLVGPLDAARLRPDLENEIDESEGIGLRRLLATLVEDVAVEQLDGADWVRFEKRLMDGERGERV